MIARTLLILLLVAFGAFVTMAIISPDWSGGDVARCVAFTVLFIFLVLRLLAAQPEKDVESQYGSPRFLRIVFASLALAFAISMLLSVAALPWLGFKVFDYVLGEVSWWGLPLVAALLYPLVRLRLN